MRKMNKKIAAVAVGAVALTGTGVAYAYWTTTGTGNGTAVTSAGTANQLSFTGSSTAAMAPGIDAHTVNGTVSNASTVENVYVTSVKTYLEVIPVAGGSCDVSDFVLQGQSAANSAVTAVAVTGFAAGELAKKNAVTADPASTKSFSVSLGFNNKATSQDGCKSAQVKVHYVAA